MVDDGELCHAGDTHLNCNDPLANDDGSLCDNSGPRVAVPEHFWRYGQMHSRVIRGCMTRRVMGAD